MSNLPDFPKVLVHTAHDIDGSPLVTTYVGPWQAVLNRVFDTPIATQRFDLWINPWGLVEGEIPVDYDSLVDVCEGAPGKLVVCTFCDSSLHPGHKSVTFHDFSAEAKRLDIFLGNLTEKDREVFDNCACGAVHYRDCICLSSLVLDELLGAPSTDGGS